MGRAFRIMRTGVSSWGSTAGNIHPDIFTRKLDRLVAHYCLRLTVPGASAAAGMHGIGCSRALDTPDARRWDSMVVNFCYLPERLLRCASCAVAPAGRGAKATPC